LHTRRFNRVDLHQFNGKQSGAGCCYAAAVKIRIDRLLVERGVAPSRERAQALILAGKILVNEQKVEKPGTVVPSDAALRLVGEDLPYVSRGGLKLEAALHHWSIDVRHWVCLDVGASTGGFTDCLLQHGAERVIAADTGYGQLDFRLRQDPRVQLLENKNARYLRAEDLNAAVELVAMDVSFISATQVLPAVLQAVRQAAGQRAGQPGPGDDLGGAYPREVIVLVKPQFEVGRELVGKGGIVRDEAARQAAVDKVRRAVIELGAASVEVIDSPILGREGNREFLLRARFSAVLPVEASRGDG